MAQAVAYLLTSVGATAAATTLVTTAGTLTLAGVALNVVASIVISNLARPDIPEAARPDNIQSLSKNTSGPRIKHYGVVKVGGNVVFHRASEGFSYRVIVHGHGEISNILQRFINNEPVTVDGNGFVTDAQYQLDRSRVRLLARAGLAPSSHYAEIAQVWPEWTVAHRLDGLWSTLVICETVPPEHYRGMYPKNEPDVSILAETTKCLDPRSGQTLFTENMALAIADYVASPDGFNRPNAFDPADIAAQADLCDAPVALAAGGTEPLYRISGSYLLNEKPQTVLGRMLQSCAGRIRLKPSGKIGLNVGVWTEPEFVLGFSDILEVQEVNAGPDLLDRYNELPARFNSHDLGHIEVDAEPWRDNLRVIEDGEVLTGQDKNLMMCPSHRQARQVMKIHMERDNPRQEVTLLCKPKALPAIYENVISLSVPQLALVGDYEVARYSVNFERGLLKAVGLTLRKVSSEAFALSLSEQGGVQQMPEPNTPAGVPVPQNVTAAAAGVQVASNVWAAGIGVGWEAPPSDALTPLLKFTKKGEGNWQSVAVDSSVQTAHLTNLVDGQLYDISLAFVTPGGVVGNAVILPNVVASAVADPPLPPTDLTVSDAGGSTALVEMTASSSGGLWKTEIYRDSNLVGVIYAGPGSQIALIDNCGVGSFNWTARSINVSNIKSTSDAGPVSATIA